jgi:hypothetical protein
MHSDMRAFKDGLLRGAGIFIGFSAMLTLTALAAQAVTQFSSGQTLTAAALNALVNRINSPLPIVTSGSSGFHSNTNTGYTDVTNLDVTVTSDGSPIWVGLIADGSGNPCWVGVEDNASGSASADFALWRDGAVIVEWTAAAEETGTAPYTSIPCGSVWHLDQPGAGTFNYRIQIRSTNASDTGYVRYARLFAARFNEL